MRKLQFFVLCWTLAAIPTPCGPSTGDVRYPSVPQAVVLSLAAKHYPDILRALSTVGFEVREVSQYGSWRHEHPPLLVVPAGEATQLTPQLVTAIVHDLEGGMPLLLDGSSPLTEALNLRFLRRHGEMTRYYWEQYAEDPLRLPGRVAYPRLQASPAQKMLAVDSRQKTPLVVSGRRGQGSFIYSAIPLEPASGMVFQYLPFLAQAIVDQLQIVPSLAADNLCVYIDFGGEPKADPEAVVARLKSWSVREVHLGSFYGSEMFQQFVPRFIAAAHREGIAVYAWLEYPMVSQEFWNEHPQWRELTADGHPAVMDWRLHMALEDPACFQAVADLTRRLVRDYDWDGVDFAELYFEGEPGIFKYPRDFTPMHPSFRRMFQQRYGVEPRELFDSASPNYGLRNPALRRDLEQFRVELITQLTENFLQVLANCKTQKPYLQTTLTFIDTLRDPTVTERFGVDADRLLALQKRFGFAVEIEDPYTVWNSSPDRYRAIGEYYRPRLLPGTPFTIDINVVDRIPPGRPLNKPRGLELYELVSNVAAHVDLITLYAFSTLPPDDMRLVPAVIGAQQLEGEPSADGTLRARRQLIWQTDTRGRGVEMDGHAWPCVSDSEVLIPAGEHRVLTRPLSEGAGETPLRIEGVNGAILAAERSGERVEFTYESRGRCYVTVNRAPATVFCDGAPNLAKVLGEGSHVCLVLPQGKHVVQMR